MKLTLWAAMAAVALALAGCNSSEPETQSCDDWAQAEGEYTASAYTQLCQTAWNKGWDIDNMTKEHYEIAMSEAEDEWRGIIRKLQDGKDQGVF